MVLSIYLHNQGQSSNSPSHFALFCNKTLIFFFSVINLYSLVGRRCVICQMEYKRGDRRITLPCKHLYHAGCGTRWLSINKVSCSGFFTIWICWCFESVGLSLADSIWFFRLAQYVTLRCLLMRQSARNNPDELKKDESLQSRWFFFFKRGGYTEMFASFFHVICRSIVLAVIRKMKILRSEEFR